MASEARQRIIEVNRSLRTIKNELESLLDKGHVSEETFLEITSLLPAELSISGAGSSATRHSGAAQSPNAVVAALTRAAEATSLHDNHHGSPVSSHPPAYTPTLPSRTNTGHQQEKQQPVAAAAPVATPTSSAGGPPPFLPPRPVIAHARALYAYAATDARDCALQRNDVVAVYEYMNADWWLGRNTRTGQEGVFPKTYVELIPGGDSADSGYPDEKSKAHGSSSQGGYQSMQGMPQFVHDANSSSHVQPSGHEGTAGKAGEYGKKFGKKLGNAAIFGAGATIGSNIVNSIF